MLLNVDFRQLELLCAFWLSKDPLGCQEILTGFDIHADNQKRLGLPERVIAKIFIFRLIYGGTAGAYAHDAEFIKVSRSQEFWQGLIDKFYQKYKGLKLWHDQLLVEAMTTGRIVIPTGRTWNFTPYTNKYNKKVWPRTKILNYPVQGLGADLMVLARILVQEALGALEPIEGVPMPLLVCTVHDSIVIDCPKPLIAATANCVLQAWAKIPVMFEQYFGVPLELPCRCEIKVGPDWAHMEEWHGSIH